MIDVDALRRCLGQYATGVTVVTSQVGGCPIAMTANSFTSVSLDPPLVSWSVKRSSQSYPKFAVASGFVVNILAEDQVDISRNFGRSAGDKFAGIAWRPGLEGMPLLEGVAALFECEVVDRLDGGDHLIIIGRVARFERHERSVLLFAQGRYAVARDHPAMQPAMESSVARGPTEDFIAGLMYRAYGALAQQMEAVQREQGYTPAEARIMGAVATFPARTVAELLPELYLGEAATETAVARLVELEIVGIDADGRLSMTLVGTSRLGELLAALGRQQADVLEGLPQGDIDAARRLMRHVIRRSKPIEKAPRQ